MLTFKCDLCREEWQVKEKEQCVAVINYFYIFKGKKHEVPSDLRYCHLCQEKIDKAGQEAQEKAKEMKIKELMRKS